jgi:hypothetical protein
MGLHIDAAGASREVGGGKVVADRALFCDTAMTVLLEAGDERAGIQLASRAGKIVPAGFVVALGLTVDKSGRVVQVGAEPDAAPEAEVKPSEPAESKPVRQAESKPKKATKKRSKKA